MAEDYAPSLGQRFHKMESNVEWLLKTVAELQEQQKATNHLSRPEALCAQASAYIRTLLHNPEYLELSDFKRDLAAWLDRYEREI